MFKTRVLSKNQSSLGDERQSNLTQVLYILRNNANTFSEIKNNFLEVLGSNLRHHHAQNQGYVKKNREVSESSDNLTSRRSYTPLNTMRIHSRGSILLQTKVMSKKQMSLGIERQGDLPEVSYILNNNVNTLSEMNSNLPEGLGPISRYHHAKNQGYVGRKDKSMN